jgi:hypothetical protein
VSLIEADALSELQPLLKNQINNPITRSASNNGNKNFIPFRDPSEEELLIAVFAVDDIEVTAELKPVKLAIDPSPVGNAESI